MCITSSWISESIPVNERVPHSTLTNDNVLKSSDHVSSRLSLLIRMMSSKDTPVLSNQSNSISGRNSMAFELSMVLTSELILSAKHALRRELFTEMEEIIERLADNL